MNGILHTLLDRSPLFLLLLLTVFVFVLAYTRRLPPIWDIKLMLSTVNDKGGQILLLVSLSCWFFSVAMKMFYFAIQKVADKSLTPDNAVLLMGLTFVTGTAFGGSFGAFLKTLDGGNDIQRRAVNTEDAVRKIATEVVSTSAAQADKIPPAGTEKT
jgi:hypothetical protein